MENKEQKKVFKADRTISFFIIAAGLAAFLTAVIFDLKIVVTAILALLAATATFEIIRAVGAKSKVLFAVACAVSFVSVMNYGFGFLPAMPAVLCGIYVLVLMSIMVFFNKEIWKDEKPKASPDK